MQLQKGITEHSRNESKDLAYGSKKVHCAAHMNHTDDTKRKNQCKLMLTKSSRSKAVKMISADCIIEVTILYQKTCLITKVP